MIRVENVTHHYGIRPVLKNVSLEINTGEVVVVVGPNGMGKTTLLGVMAGVLWPLAGTVEFDGIKRRESAEGESKLRKRSVYLPDQPWLPKLRTGREYILSVGRLYGIDDLRLFDHADRLLQLFDLQQQAEQPIYSYSAGQIKKTALASALITEAPYMLLDEPFSGGLDPSGILALKRVVQHLAKREDVTIVMTTPVPELVEELADRVVIIRDGELIAFDTVANLRQLSGRSDTLAEVLQKLLNPETSANLDHYLRASAPRGGLDMIQHLRRRLRVVLPIDQLAYLVLVVLLVLAAIQYVRGLGPADKPATWQIFMVLGTTLLYAAFRCIYFHPVENRRYGSWLADTPWRHPQPLPLGPLHLVWQDAVLVLVWSELLPTDTFSRWTVPILFLLTYCFGMGFTFCRMGIKLPVFVMGLFSGAFVLVLPNATWCMSDRSAYNLCRHVLGDSAVARASFNWRGLTVRPQLEFADRTGRTALGLASAARADRAVPLERLPRRCNSDRRGGRLALLLRCVAMSRRDSL